MKKAFIVTQGTYSDYHICGVFDKKELAELFINSFEGSYDKMEIEEWDLNPFKLELNKGMRAYFVRMDREGNASEVDITDSVYGFKEKKPYGFDVKKNMYNYCFAKDKQHAIKITNEKRISLIVEDKWLK